jgi:hypothetical protein
VNMTGRITTHDFFMQPVDWEGTDSPDTPSRGDGGPVKHRAEPGKGPTVVIQLP